MATVTTFHLSEFTTKVIKVIALLGAHSLQCIRNSPAITGKPDINAVKARVVAWGKQECRIDFDKYPIEISPMQLNDIDLDPSSAAEYQVYFRVITHLISFITNELYLLIKSGNVPARTNMNRVVMGWLDATIDKFLAQ